MDVSFQGPAVLAGKLPIRDLKARGVRLPTWHGENPVAFDSKRSQHPQLDQVRLHDVIVNGLTSRPSIIGKQDQDDHLRQRERLRAGHLCSLSAADLPFQ